MERFDVIIPAAGSGTRMGSSIPKLVMEVGGKAVIRRTVEAFLDNFDNCRITVVTSEDAVKEALAGLPVRFAAGGGSRRSV